MLTEHSSRGRERTRCCYTHEGINSDNNILRWTFLFPFYRWEKRSRKVSGLTKDTQLVSGAVSFKRSSPQTILCSLQEPPPPQHTHTEGRKRLPLNRRLVVQNDSLSDSKSWEVTDTQNAQSLVFLPLPRRASGWHICFLPSLQVSWEKHHLGLFLFWVTLNSLHLLLMKRSPLKSSRSPSPYHLESLKKYDSA